MYGSLICILVGLGLGNFLPLAVGDDAEAEAYKRLDALLNDPRFSYLRTLRQTANPPDADYAHMEKGMPGEVRSLLDANLPIAHLFYGGDILLTSAQVDSMQNSVSPDADGEEEGRRKRRQAVFTGPTFPLNRWNPETPIAYYLDSSLDVRTKSLIREAIDFWQNHTCLSFKEDGDETPRVRFFRGPGCFSQVGKDVFSREQHVSIGEYCAFYAPIAHEIGHVLGLLHTHTRYDRDNHIAVVKRNVPPEMASLFENDTPGTSATLHVGYDYGSIMHFTAYNKRTSRALMWARRPNYQHSMGNSYGPVFSDLLVVNRLYTCDSRCEDVERKTQCKNDGFPNPNNCNQCICPNGFGGTLCEQRASGEGGAPPDCGVSVEAGEQYQTLKGEVDAPSDGQERQAGCHFHIAAPPHQRVEIVFNSVKGSCTPECLFGAVEVKYELLARGGARVCCEEHLIDIGRITSTGNLAIVSDYSQREPRSFSLRYRAVPARTPNTGEPRGSNEGFGDWNGGSAGPSEATGDPSGPWEPVRNCRDRSPSCAENANTCNVSVAKATMRRFCPKTCGLCDGEGEGHGEGLGPSPPMGEGGPVQNCTDMTADCQEAGVKNICNLPLFAPSVRLHCAATCGVCAANTEGDTLNGTEVQDESSILRDCMDDSHRCRSVMGLCDMHPFQLGIRKLCPLTCGICALGEKLVPRPDNEDDNNNGPSTFTPSNCFDRSEVCVSMTALCGEGRLGVVIRRVCPHTCGLCPSGRATCIDNFPQCRQVTDQCRWDRRVAVACPKACGLCSGSNGNGQPSLLPSLPSQPVDEGQGLGFTPPTDRNGGPWPTTDPDEWSPPPSNETKGGNEQGGEDCRDALEDCESRVGQCVYPAMKRLCRRTCGQCMTVTSDVDTNEVTDPTESDEGETTVMPLPCTSPFFQDDKKCATWGRNGICHLFFMRELAKSRCPKMCGIC